jgi:hypothetical protein
VTSCSWEPDADEPQRPTHNDAGQPIDWGAFERIERENMQSPGLKLWKLDCRCEPWAHWQPDAKASLWWVHWHHDADCPAAKRMMAPYN